MKKLLALFACGVIALSFAACSSTHDTKATKAKHNASAKKHASKSTAHHAAKPAAHKTTAHK